MTASTRNALLRLVVWEVSMFALSVFLYLIFGP